MDYAVVNSKDVRNSSKSNNIDKIIDSLTIGVVIYFIYHFALRLGLLNVFNTFPEASLGMSYSVLFVIGALTSIHCIAMCGGINLSQCIPTQRESIDGRGSSLKPSLMYNMGRVVSYTIIGGVVGAIGSVVSFSGAAKGIVAIFAGIFMVIMGVNMLNIFPWLRKFNPRLPRFLGNIVHRHKRGHSSQFMVGLLNGLMPCGPLQAMQLYALSTGDPIKGALSMFFFSLGTTPLMFGLGAISSLLSKKLTNKMLQISAVLVAILGFAMFQTGLGVSGIQIPSIYSLIGSVQAIDNVAVVEEDGIQYVTSNITGGRYESISVQAGIKTQWTIHVDEGELSGCNYRIIIPALGRDIELQTGDNIIEFTPKEKGIIAFSCWMGMIRSQIEVI
jgi:sulfite exporter TauE/SafE